MLGGEFKRGGGGIKRREGGYKRGGGEFKRGGGGFKRGGGGFKRGGGGFERGGGEFKRGGGGFKHGGGGFERGGGGFTRGRGWIRASRARCVPSGLVIRGWRYKGRDQDGEVYLCGSTLPGQTTRGPPVPERTSTHYDPVGKHFLGVSKIGFVTTLTKFRTNAKVCRADLLPYEQDEQWG
eukprot:1191943-Prorocentrum_minimum.AAC.4